MYPHLQPLIPPRELWTGTGDTHDHFMRPIWEYRTILTALCNLTRNSNILEIGCGHGRLALGLVDYLTTGSYTGIDINKKQIDFAQENITPRYKNFSFHYADIQNPSYNPNGKLNPETYIFPFDDRSFNIILAASIFTHTTENTFENYMKETNRLIKSRGFCLFSFFIIDFYQGKGTSICNYYEFPYRLTDNTWASSKTPSEALIAYERRYLETTALSHEFTTDPVLPGYWSNNYRGVLEQDHMILSFYH